MGASSRAQALIVDGAKARGGTRGRCTQYTPESTCPPASPSELLATHIATELASDADTMPPNPLSLCPSLSLWLQAHAKYLDLPRVRMAEQGGLRRGRQTRPRPWPCEHAFDQTNPGPYPQGPKPQSLGNDRSKATSRRERSSSKPLFHRYEHRRYSAVSAVVRPYSTESRYYRPQQSGVSRASPNWQCIDGEVGGWPTAADPGSSASVRLGGCLHFANDACDGVPLPVRLAGSIQQRHGHTSALLSARKDDAKLYCTEANRPHQRRH
nr:hypothetical protein CFP56_02976 [Quercus suber]